MKVMTVAMKDITWIITRKCNQGEITSQRDLWIPSTAIILSLDWIPAFSFSYLAMTSSPFPPALQFPLYLPSPLQAWIQHCLQSCSFSHAFAFLQPFLQSLNNLSKIHYHQQETLSFSTFRAVHEMLISFCHSRSQDENDNSSTTHTIHIIPLRCRRLSLSLSLQPVPTPAGTSSSSSTNSYITNRCDHHHPTGVSTIQQLEYFSIQIHPSSLHSPPTVNFCVVTISGAYVQQLSLRIGEGYTLHNLRSIHSTHSYPLFHFTSSSSVQRCSVQTRSSSVQFAKRSICAAASLLSGVPQIIQDCQDDQSCNSCIHNWKGWRREVDGIVMEATEYSQFQHAFIDHLRSANILHTPVSLLDQIQSPSTSSPSSSSYWLVGLVVDCLTTANTSLLRLRDLNTDAILQLQCPSLPERFSLWEVVLLTDVQVDINEQERYVVVSHSSSMFVIPQTGFLHAALSYCPQRTDWRLSSCLFEWKVVEVERILSVKVCQVCPKCMQAIVNRVNHLRNCGLPESTDLPIYLECTFFGISDFMQIKG